MKKVKVNQIMIKKNKQKIIIITKFKKIIKQKERQCKWFYSSQDMILNKQRKKNQNKQKFIVQSKVIELKKNNNNLRLMF